MVRRAGVLSSLDRTGIPLLVVRLVLGGMFVWMGTAKIGDPVHFLKLMRQYEVLPTSPPHFLNTVAVVLPWIEAACGAALILGVAIRGAGLVSAVMLILFTPLIFLRGLEIYYQGGVSFCDVNFDCGCGAGVVFLCHKLAENAGMFLLALLAIFSHSRRFCLDGRRLARGPSFAVAPQGPPVTD